MNALRLLVVSMLLLLAGCGFHLRGEVSLSAELQRIHIKGVSQYSTLGTALKRSLRSQGVEIVDSPTAASAILKISEPDYSRRLLSVNAVSGKVNEYEIQYSLNVTLLDRGGKVLLKQQQLRQLRDFTFDRDRVLGKGNEEARLRTDMERDLAAQVLRRLQAYRRG